MDIPQVNIKNLFGSHDGAADQLETAKRFVEKRRAEGKADGVNIGDIIIYYVGHGDFAGDSRDFYLSIRRTSEEQPLLTSITARAFGDWIRRTVRGLRTYIIADCCFAAGLQAGFLTSNLSLAALRIREAIPPGTRSKEDSKKSIPESGVALLAAAGRNQPADGNPGGEQTTFTGTMLEVLREGQIRGPKYLSLDDLFELIQVKLKQRPYPVAPPELHPVQQNQGRIEFLGLFPNRSFVECNERNRGAAPGRAEDTAKTSQEPGSAENTAKETQESGTAEDTAKETQRPGGNEWPLWLARRRYVVVISVVFVVAIAIIICLSQSNQCTSLPFSQRPTSCLGK